MKHPVCRTIVTLLEAGALMVAVTSCCDVPEPCAPTLPCRNDPKVEVKREEPAAQTTSALPRVAPADRIRIPDVFRSRGSCALSKGGKEASRDQVLGLFEGSRRLRLRSGKEITSQELIDQLANIENELRKSGKSLVMLQRHTWASPETTPAAVEKDRKAHEAKLKQLRAASKTGRSALPSQTPSSCTLDTCVPQPSAKSQPWSAEHGERKWVSFGTSFNVSEETPSARSAQCSVDWDNYIYLLDEKFSILHYAGSATAMSGATPTKSVSETLDVVGVRVPPSSAGDWGFQHRELARVTVTVPILAPIISARGSLWAQGSLFLTPGALVEADAEKAWCGIGFEPGLSVTVGGTAEIVVGISGIVDLITGGITGYVTPIDLHMPTRVEANLDVFHARNVGIGRVGGRIGPERVRGWWEDDGRRPFDRLMEGKPVGQIEMSSDLDARFMVGRIYAYYELADICWLGWCLVEDGLGIPTYGEYDIANFEGLDYKLPLLDPPVHSALTFVPK